MWSWDEGHMDDGWGIAMMLGMLGFWVLVTAAIGFAIVWAVRSARTPTAGASGGTTTTGSPEQVLADRLARGDIDIEEYQARLAALGRSTP